MEPNTKKKLHLRRETVRKLEESELAKVVSGCEDDLFELICGKCRYLGQSACGGQGCNNCE
jgi:hypothetical protein